MGEGEIQFFDKIKEVFDFRWVLPARCQRGSSSTINLPTFASFKMQLAHSRLAPTRRYAAPPGQPAWLLAKYRSFYGLQQAVKEGAESELKAAVTVSAAAGCTCIELVVLFFRGGCFICWVAEG